MDRFRQNRRQSVQRKQQKQTPATFSLYSPQKKRERQQIHVVQGTTQSPIPTQRISQHLLIKQAINTRKYEEAQQKLREKEAAYRHIFDMYEKVVKEKEGIEASLNQQIDMYRNLIKDIQSRAQQRLKEVQKAFKEEMERKLEEKEEQARIMQAEKDELEQFVTDLQKIGDQLEIKLNNTSGDLKNTQEQLQKTEQQKRNVIQKLQAAEQYSKSQNEKYQDIVDKLKEQVINTERDWRDKLDEAGKQKQKALKEQEKQFKEEITKIHEKYEGEKGDRKEEIKNLMDGFEAEKTRLNQIIAAKEKAIEDHHRQSKQGSEKLNCAIRGYEQEIQSLASEKARLFEEVDKLNSENTHLNVLIKELQLNGANEKKNLQSYILKLKQEITFSQSNFLRERDRNIVTYEDSSKQIIAMKRQIAILQAENEKLRQQTGDSNALEAQVRKLRDMLLQSSYELEKCKAEFVKISKERDLMGIRLGEASYEVGALRRIKVEKEEQARGWRDSYYLNRSRSIRR